MLSTKRLVGIFTLQPGKLYLRARESRTLEFKIQFNRAGLAEMAKDMAAFANNKGGYLVYGVKNNPREPIGINNNNFDNIDDAEITQAINEYFAPSINWERTIYEWTGKRFGVVYTHASENKPVVAVKNGGHDVIRQGEIYYRYGARTERIRYAELRAIIDEKVSKERKAWLKLFKRIGRIGPENAAILDTIEGQIESENRTILIDDALINKIKFIREGEFREREGAVTLKLVGEVHPVEATGRIKQIVHADPYVLRAKDVAQKVNETISRQFRTQPEHVRAWSYYHIRGTYEEGKNACNPKYCDYKEALETFMYNQEWVDFLIAEMSDSDKYDAVMSFSK